MTVNGGGAQDDAASVDHTPPAFPSVGESRGSESMGPVTTGEPSSLFASTSPIQTKPLDPRAPRRGGRFRWIVAGLATLVVIALVGGVLFLAAPRAGAASATAHYAPADASMYVELRLDLPGDQHDNLAAFMSHFPGFADRASFQQKLDEALNTMLSSRSGGAVNWTTDVKPWFGGQVAFFGDIYAHAPVPMPACPTASAVAECIQIGNSAASQAHNGVIALTVTDKTKLQATIDSHSAGAAVTMTDYQGQQIKTLKGTDGGADESYVISDDAVLVSSDIQRLQQALDVKAGHKPALGDDSYFTQQLAALHADRLATVYFNSGSLIAQMPQPSGAPLSADCTNTMNGAASTKIVGEVRAEVDHMAFTLRQPLATGDNAPPAPPNRQTALAQSMPADTTVYLETHGTGAGVSWLIKHGLSCMSSMSQAGGALPTGLGNLGSMGDPSALFQQFLGVKPEDYLDFVGDAAIGLTYSNDKIGGGLVATVDDQATATQRVDKLVSLVKVFGIGFGGGFGSGSISMPQIATEELDHNGTKVTVIHVAATEPGKPPMTLQLAVANGKLYVGLDDFVTAALDRQPADSLASSAGYQKALSAAPADNSGVLYVDPPRAISAAEEKMSVGDRAQFDANTKPLLDPLGSFSVVSHVDGGIVVSNGFLFVE